jgi:hypothetical protein
LPILMTLAFAGGSNNSSLHGDSIPWHIQFHGRWIG